MRTEIHLPYPPSVNQLYTTNGRSFKRYKSGMYNSWIADAGWTLKTQKRNEHKGRISVSYFARRPDKRKRDIDNVAKAICDFLTLHRIIEDDQHIQAIYGAWDDSVPASKIKVVVENL